MRKKILSLLLSLILCTAFLPTSALADYEQTGTYIQDVPGGTITYTCNYTSGFAAVTGYSGDITEADILSYITSGSATLPVTVVNYDALSGCSSLTRLTLPETLTGIMPGAFNGAAITSVDIPSSVKTLSGFANCKNLTSVTIPNNVIEIGENAFQNCAGLETVSIPNSVTVIGDHAFEGCSSLSSINIPASVTAINAYAFRYCTALTSVTIPGTAKIIRANAFEGCTALTHVTVEQGVESIYGEAFKDCSALVEISLPASLTYLGYDLLKNASDSVVVNYAGTEAAWKTILTSSYYNNRLNVVYGAAQIAPSFADVSSDAWYADPVTWAVGQGITNGTSETTFSPDDTCTRGQIITFLYRAAGSPAVSGTANVSDAGNTYYTDAVLWAAENGLFSGSAFSPDAPCTREMAVEFMWKYAGSPAAAEASFTDVSSDAVNWAVAQGVTNGTSETTFSPDTTCTRAQIVTFLYRAFK